MTSPNVAKFIALLQTEKLDKFKTTSFQITHVPTDVSVWVGNGWFFLSLEKGSLTEKCSILDKIRLQKACNVFASRVISESLGSNK